jgi:hypothetical protein
VRAGWRRRKNEGDEAAEEKEEEVGVRGTRAVTPAGATRSLYCRPLKLPAERRSSC